MSMLDDPHQRASGLLDRGSERDVLERLVTGVRAGQSRVLVLRGEAGIGKTPLPVHLSALPEGFRIARIPGGAPRMGLPLAGPPPAAPPVPCPPHPLPHPPRD